MSKMTSALAAMQIALMLMSTMDWLIQVFDATTERSTAKYFINL